MSLTPVQQKAYDGISTRLREEHFWNDTNEADLSSVRTTLQSLSAADADAVIDEMAKNGQLQRLADESNDSEFAGIGQDGFSADQQRDLFNDLAGKLDGDSLGKVHAAYAVAEDGNTEVGRLSELGQAIAGHATPQAKVDYINAVKSGIGDGYVGTAQPGGSNAHNVDSDAAAVGNVLGSLRGDYATQAFKSLSPDQVRNVLRTGIDQTVHVSQGGVTSSYDATGFKNVMAAAASSGDLTVKATVLAAGAEQLRTVRDADNFPALSVDSKANLKVMGAAMAGVIDSAPNGVMKEMAYDTKTRDGSAMGTYAQVMIETGQTSRLSSQMVSLQLGNNHDQNPVKFLDQATTLPNGQVQRQNAGALGYFVGSVYAGAAAHSSDVKTQQEVITNFLKFAADKIPGAGGLKPTDAMLGQDMIKIAVEAALKDPGMDPAQRLEAAALPSDANGRLAVGDPIYSAFEDTLATTQRLAKP